jgi:NADH-dependent peroxiredoxin subunit F
MESNYDLIIVGGGPAGITAGIYASRLGLKSLLVTKSIGGQMASKPVAIDNYPGFKNIEGSELIKKMEVHLKSLNMEICFDEVVLVKKNTNLFEVELKSERKLNSKALIVTSGAEAKHLNVPGEQEFTGKGVGYCAVCDGPLFKDKEVVVVGGGNVGFETAIFLSNIASKIYILEYSDQVKAFEKIINLAKGSGKLEIITSAQVKEIKGDKFVKSLVYKDVMDNTEKELLVQGIFIVIGYTAVTQYIQNLVDFNSRGEIIVDSETMKTRTGGLFAAGDVTNGLYKQIVISAGEGAKAALSAYKYIKGSTIEK